MTDVLTQSIWSQSRGSRRDFLRAGLFGVGIGAGLPALLARTSGLLAAQELADQGAIDRERILVVVELSGGNDGLNSVVPYRQEAYYRARPRIAIAPNEVRRLDDEIGLHPSLIGCERLFKEGRLAVVHGCGYEHPNFSHKTSMEYWHTGVPNGSDSRGWVGRLADANWPRPVDHLLVNLGPLQKYAVQSAVHAPIVFNDPEKFTRALSKREKEVLPELLKSRPTRNPTLAYVERMSVLAANSSELVKTACAEYRSQTNYGAGNLRNDLRQVAALLAAKFPARIYYVSTGGWDTHAGQLTAHQLRLGYLDDALTAFLIDLRQIGRADDVAVMMFSEFGRRVEENASGGTDHGAAGPMFVFGEKIRGGFYGQHPSFTELIDGNLKMTVDFRRVYATLINEWMGYQDTQAILRGDFPPLNMFG